MRITPSARDLDGKDDRIGSEIADTAKRPGGISF
jgi:hypothetical protein